MDAMRIYQYSSPGRLVFGPGASAEVRKELGPHDRLLVVTDPGVVRAGILKTVTDALGAAGVSLEVFDGVQADPPIEVVEAAAARYREKRCSCVLGLGGGSSMDTAKAVSVLGSGGGTVKEYCSGKPIAGPLPPVFAVPTTAGTGSEATAVAVVSDPLGKMKRVLKDPSLVPRVAFLDPHLLASLPPKVAAETGADALTHAIESYLSAGGHAITDALSLSAVRMITRNLPRFVANSRDVEAAGQMLLASYMAGLSFKNAGLGLVHSMAHPVGVYFHLSHGVSCALYLPTVMEFNAPACPEKFAALAEAMGLAADARSPDETASRAVGAVRALFQEVGIPRTFSELGVKFQLRPEMLEEALAAIPTKTNPRPAGRSEVEALFSSPAGSARV